MTAVSAESADPSATEVVLTPWKRYGHDRLYAQTTAGVRLGYRDNHTGAVVLADPAYRDALDRALADAPPHLAAGPAQPTEVVSSEPVASAGLRESSLPAEKSVPTEPSEKRVPAVPAQKSEPVAHPEPDALPAGGPDLAAIRPGAAARARARELRKAAPVRTFIARVVGVKNDERAWRIGADGEEAVAAQLRTLGSRWKVLHAVPIGDRGSDIDHVIIGPGGVFTINAKHHPDATVWVGGDTVMIGGHRVPYVRNSRHEALRAARLLTTAIDDGPITVTGVIAFVGCRAITVSEPPPGGDVVVVGRRKLATWLQRRPEVLTGDRVLALYDVARRGETWR